MAYLLKNIKSKFFEILPIVLLFFISFNGNSIIDLKYFSIKSQNNGFRRFSH